MARDVSLIDRALRSIAPGYAAKRLAAKIQFDSLAAARGVVMEYRAARRDHRTAGWRSSRIDVNGEIGRAGPYLRDIARDMVRNKPHAKRAVACLVNNIVGTGAWPKAVSSDKSRAKTIEKMIVDHLDTAAVDPEGRLNIYSKQRQMMRCCIEAGEALAVRKRLDTARMKKIGAALPFQIELLEPDHIDTNKTDFSRTGSGARIIQGVEFDGEGRRVAYWIFPDHPGATDRTTAKVESKRIPAEDVAHIFDPERIGQVRGMTWLAPGIMRAQDYADFIDAQLVRQKVAACFAAFVTRAPGSSTSIGNAIAAQGEPTSQSQTPFEAMEPGMVEYLSAGDDIKFASPPGLDGFDAYTTITLREIAVAWGVTYALLTGDQSQENFAAGRMGHVEFQRSCEAARDHIVTPGSLTPFSRWFLEAASLRADVRPGDRIDWQFNHRVIFDPSKETKAEVEAVGAGLQSRSRYLRGMGIDPDRHDQEIVEDAARLKKLADAAGVTITLSNEQKPAAPAQQEPAHG